MSSASVDPRPPEPVSEDAAPALIAPELLGPTVILVPAGAEHADALVAILAEPAVQRWWNEPPEAVRSWLARPDDGETAFAILDAADRTVIGYLQVVEETTPQYRHAGIDLFVTTDRQGRGAGPEAIRLAARWLIDERGHHRLTIDPAADNARAIRAYAKVGFRPVGIMRRYERGPDGSWHDGLLMDLLAEELR